MLPFKDGLTSKEDKDMYQLHINNVHREIYFIHEHTGVMTYKAVAQMFVP
jgi:hypothetical protein